MENLKLTHESKAYQGLMLQIYVWMALALLLTAIVSFFIGVTPALSYKLFENRSLFFVLAIAEILMVIVLSARIDKLSSQAALLLFAVYSVVNGITLSWIFIAYDLMSIASVFVVTAGTFGIMCAYGYVTKKDLSGIGNICFMALIGLILASIVNIFILNDMFSMIISSVGVIVFVALTAYDTQKIKRMAISFNYTDDIEVRNKVSILGALTLYLDFINLFIYILRIFGKKR